jgi:D-alanine-D-alanine ligase
MPDRKLNVAVLMGGPSSEHDVSLATGQVLLQYLDRRKYEIKPVTISREIRELLPAEPPSAGRELRGASSSRASAPDLLPVSTALRQAQEAKIDVVFIAMHGEFGEDGRLQGLLEFFDIPYTGSGVLASSLAMDKVKSSELFRLHGLLVPPYTHFRRWEWERHQPLILDFLVQAFESPWVIKPVDRGSSVGVSIARTEDALRSAIGEVFQRSDHVMVQQYIQGVEVTCAVLHEDPRSEPWPLPPTQIVPKAKAFFDYFSKYTPGATEEITPPQLPPHVIAQIQAIAVRAHEILDCYGMSRTDMIVQGEQIYVLETNTIPGMTETSLYPQAAKAIGLEFSELLDRLISAALRRHQLHHTGPRLS